MESKEGGKLSSLNVLITKHMKTQNTKLVYNQPIQIFKRILIPPHSTQKIRSQHKITFTELIKTHRDTQVSRELS